MVVRIIVVVVNLEDSVDGEEIRFVAIANMSKEYHGFADFQAEFMGKFPGWFQGGESVENRPASPKPQKAGWNRSIPIPPFAIR
jgi:hypothetical protein